MRIKTIAWVMFGTAIVLFSLTGISVVMLNTSEKEEIQALHRQAEFRKLGIELADASDYLTNEVQAYTQFGDQVHYDNYWREVRGTHTRDHVVQRLYELNAPAEELNLIELAKGNSDALIAIEEQAMAAVEQGDLETARRLVFDQNYIRFKKSIMDPIHQFQQIMNNRAGAEASEAVRRAELMLRLSTLLILVSALVTSAMIYLVMIRRTVRPVMALTAAMRRLADGDTGVDIPETRSRDEIAEMISAVGVFRVNAIERARLETERAERTAELDQKNRQLGKALKQLEDELEIARQMQLSILPTNYPERDDIEAFGKMLAARELGGDFYDIIEIDSHRIGIIIADVSGKGVPAALFMAVSCTIMKTTALRGGGPGEVLEKVNAVLSQENESAMFVTLFYGIIDIRNDGLTYANAGHNPPFLLSQDETVTELKGTGGVALGALEGLRYAEKSMVLQAGDTIFCYTDGVTEATDSEGNEYSEKRLKKVLYESYGLSVEALGRRVMDRVAEFAGKADQFDDITCVVLRYQSSAKAGEGETIDTVSTGYANQLPELTNMSAMVEEFCERNTLPSSLAYQVTLVLDELLTNLVNNGYDDDREHTIDVTINLYSGLLEIIMADDGVGFDPFNVDEPDLQSDVEDRPVGGLGLHFVKSIMDTIAYQNTQGKNVLTMSKKLK